MCGRLTLSSIRIALRRFTCELRRDPKFVHRLNTNTEIMAENLAQLLIDLRRLRLNCLLFARVAARLWAESYFSRYLVRVRVVLAFVCRCRTGVRYLSKSLCLVRSAYANACHDIPASRAASLTLPLACCKASFIT